MIDAVIVGSGPNGLACGIALAQKGLRVEIFESSQSYGGGLRTEELTLPGFKHDVFSACHPMALASPFFQSLPLETFDLKWIHSPSVLAHPFDDGTAAVLLRSVKETAQRLGRDKEIYESFFQSYVDHAKELMEEVLGPLLHAPKHPVLLTKFGLNALKSAESFSKKFSETKTRGMWAGIAAHAPSPLDGFATTAAGLILQIAGHSGGWPIPEGGAKRLAEALARYFMSLGGLIDTNTKISSEADLPPSKFVFFDLTPMQILKILKEKLKPETQKHFSDFKYGPGVFKMDWALKSSIPWAAKDCLSAITVHLGGTFDEIKDSEAAPDKGEVSQKPYILLCQPSLFDSSRAPEGQHTAWAYCHVPHGDTTDMTQIMENQIERFAPGFKNIILKRNTLNSAQLENVNANLVGGDINGGLIKGAQLLFKPAFKMGNPYAIDGGSKYWICSSSTPPGPGVHGMCGFRAAQSALKGS